MLIRHSRRFKKMFKKQPAWIQDKFEERVYLFQQNMYHSLLNNHALNGIWFGNKSINVTGNIRAVFEEISEGHIEFVAIGTHSELYS